MFKILKAFSKTLLKTENKQNASLTHPSQSLKDMNNIN